MEAMTIVQARTGFQEQTGRDNFKKLSFSKGKVGGAEA